MVQHSDWNESVTEPTKLKYTQTVTDYHKTKINDEKLTNIWNTAIRLGNQYNGKDGRYLNESVDEGGLDFSDLSEVCYILGLMEIKDTDQFFDYFQVK